MTRISRARISVEDGRVDNSFLKDYGELAVSANSSTSYTADLENGNVFNIAMTGNCTFTFSNPPASGTHGSFTMILTQDSAGSRTATWPSSVIWPGGATPFLTASSGNTDIFTFSTFDAGTTWFGVKAGANLRDTYTKLLLHCDGTDATTAFPDHSGFSKTVTVSGNAQVDTAQSKFGGASALFDGNTDTLNLDSSSDFAFGTGDFTIDFWMRRNGGTGALRVIYDSRPDALTSGAYPELYLETDASIRYFHDGADKITGGVISDTTWTHIALARSGTSTKLFIDGTQSGSTYSDSTNYIIGTGNAPAIGNTANNSTTNGFIGHLDEIRVSKGIARWTANFTVPTAAHS